MVKTALITGAAKRIGRTVAHHLAEKGWNIAIHFNSSEQEAIGLQDELKALFPVGQFEVFKANLYNAGEVEELIPRVIQSMGMFGLLINNASVFDKCTLPDTATELLDSNMNINFRAPFILTRDFIRLADNGLIINFVDTKITVNKANYAAYALSKKALWELTKMTALEHGPHFRANAIAPGLIETPMTQELVKKLEESESPIRKRIPAGRLGTADEVGALAAFLCSQDAGYITGTVVTIDGGRSLGDPQS